jgi:hypothetical protein
MIAPFRAALTAALLVFASSASFAQTAPSEDDAGKAGRARLAVCHADLAKLCPDAKGAKRRTCLKDNTAKLSSECASAYADVQAKAKAMREACAEDVKTHCTGVKGVTKCLRTNEAKLTPACNAAVAARFGKG